MSEDIATVLSEIDDPEIVDQILQVVNSTGETDNPQGDSSTSATLSELYQRFLSRRQNRSPATKAQYKRTIPDFVDFANERNITSPGQLSTEVVDSYVDELQGKYDSDATVLTYTKNVRGWLRWLNERQLCGEAVYRILDKQELGLTPTARDEAIPKRVITTVLDNLQKHRRGSRLHTLVALFWNAGPRIGGVHSLDVDDFDPQHNELRFRHRPESGTRLKNGDDDTGSSGDGERNIVLEDTVADALQLYIQVGRPAATDEFGRKPLFATEYGRAARSTLRRWVYEATSCRWQPQTNSHSCCDGGCNPDSDPCNQSYYPHAIRRGSIVNHLSGGLRRELASERFDVSVKVIKKHYDPRTEQDRLNDRRQAVKGAWE